MGIIYCWTNTQTNKKYIGKTIESLDKRTHRHLTETIKKDFKFSKALKKYPETNWNIEILEKCEVENLSERECYWIKYYDSFKSGYNSTLGGEGTPGRINSEFTKSKMSNSHTGKILSDSHKQNISNSLKGNTYRKGIPHSTEIKSKISNSLKGKKHSEESIQKRSDSLSKKLSKERQFVSPSGEIITVINLNGFCKEHNLLTSKMRDVFNKKRNHHKGWTSV